MQEVHSGVRADARNSIARGNGLQPEVIPRNATHDVVEDTLPPPWMQDPRLADAPGLDGQRVSTDDDDRLGCLSPHLDAGQDAYAAGTLELSGPARSRGRAPCRTPDRCG